MGKCDYKPGSKDAGESLFFCQVEQQYRVPNKVPISEIHLMQIKMLSIDI